MIKRWVLHSPYPDGTWRGIEKCLGHAGATLLFETKEEALGFIKPYGVDGFIAVSVYVEVPEIRGEVDCE